jgi:AcrR family transcriptional regulator
MGARPEREPDSRARIVDAARRLFSQRGADDVTIADVAQAAGVARATVFNHFGSKAGLLEGITEEVLGYYLVMLDNALADTETPTATLLRALFALMGRGIEEDRRFYRAVFREIAKGRLGLDEGSAGQRAGEAALERLVRVMARGQSRGELSPELGAADLASAFDSLVNGTITHWLYDDASERLELRMRRAAEVFLGAVAIGPAPAPPRRAPALAPPRERAGPRARHRRKRT